MSYNTRQNSRIGQQQQNVGNVGQIRPVVTDNIVPGGQLDPQDKQEGQMPQREEQQQEQANSEVQFRDQEQQEQQTPVEQQQASIQQQPTIQEQSEPLANQKQAQKQQLQAEQTPPTVKDESIVEDQPENEGAETSNQESPKKKGWSRSRARVARNMRLSKILQPKNAIMILHELLRNTSYDVTDCNCLSESQFKAVITVHGLAHSGYGRTKNQAKNMAAETALKYLIKHDLDQTEVKTDEIDSELLDISVDDTNKPLPWQHLASFAIYKLFALWEYDFIPKREKPEQSNRRVEVNPAKKLPENPELKCPIMLIHQMLPGAQFEETCQSENHPNRIFSMKCTVEDESYVGSGPTKKVARRMCAYETCHKVFGINYPPDVYVPKN